MCICKINLSSPSSKKRCKGEDWVVLNSVSCSGCNPFCLRVEIQISRWYCRDIIPSNPILSYSYTLEVKHGTWKSTPRKGEMVFVDLNKFHVTCMGSGQLEHITHPKNSKNHVGPFGGAGVPIQQSITAVRLNPSLVTSGGHSLSWNPTLQ